MSQAAEPDANLDDYARHQAKGGTYLVVADATEEFWIALKYAGEMAVCNECHLGVLYIVEEQEFQHWGNIEQRLIAEQREQAESCLSEACIRLEEWGCSRPSLYVEEGGRMETLAHVIENDPNITLLILGGGTHGSNPGPLVSHFTSKGLSRLRVPVMIVPDHLRI